MILDNRLVFRSNITQNYTQKRNFTALISLFQSAVLHCGLRSLQHTQARDDTIVLLCGVGAWRDSHRVDSLLTRH